jgi:hypothetical protein
MRDFKGMKRQRGRNRKPGGANNANNANPNRSWDSQGPENIKVRGNAQTVYERYMQLARDASSAGDRVLAENYTQHAEHYFRVLRALQPQRPVSEIAQRELAGQGFDIDFEDESGAQAAAFMAAQQAEQQKQDDEARRQAERAEREANRDTNRDRDNTRDRDANREAPRDRAEDDREPRADGEGGRRETRRERWERRREERSRRFERDGDAQAEGQSDARHDAGNDAPSEGREPTTEAARDDAPAQADAAPQADERRERAPRRPRTPRVVETSTDDDGPSALPGFLTRGATRAEPAAETEAGSEEAKPAPRRRSPRKKIETAADEG